MPTKLDNTWLPPESRTDWDGTKEWWPFDYGSWEYRNLKTHWIKNPDPEKAMISLAHTIQQSSVNIRYIVESYERWAALQKNSLQKITDGKDTVTLDDILWYLRYEKNKTIALILWENRTRSSGLLFEIPYEPSVIADVGNISHVLIHTIKKALDEISIKK